MMTNERPVQTDGGCLWRGVVSAACLAAQGRVLVGFAPRSTPTPTLNPGGVFPSSTQGCPGEIGEPFPRGLPPERGDF